MQREKRKLVLSLRSQAWPWPWLLRVAWVSYTGHMLSLVVDVWKETMKFALVWLVVLGQTLTPQQKCLGMVQVLVGKSGNTRKPTVFVDPPRRLRKKRRWFASCHLAFGVGHRCRLQVDIYYRITSHHHHKLDFHHPGMNSCEYYVSGLVDTKFVVYIDLQLPPLLLNHVWGMLGMTGGGGGGGIPIFFFPLWNPYQKKTCPCTYPLNPIHWNYGKNKTFHLQYHPRFTLFAKRKSSWRVVVGGSMSQHWQGDVH